MCSNKEYVSNPGSKTSDSQCAKLTECSIADDETLAYQFSGYNQYEDRVCYPCKDALEKDGNIESVNGRKPSDGAKRQYELICVSDGIPPVVVAAIVIVLVIVIILTGYCCYYRKRKITVKVDIAAMAATDCDGDGDVDGADLVSKFDANKDGSLDAKEAEAMRQELMVKENAVTLEGEDNNISIGQTTVAQEVQ